MKFKYLIMSMGVFALISCGKSADSEGKTNGSVTETSFEESMARLSPREAGEGFASKWQKLETSKAENIKNSIDNMIGNISQYSTRAEARAAFNLIFTNEEKRYEEEKMDLDAKMQEFIKKRYSDDYEKIQEFNEGYRAGLASAKPVNLDTAGVSFRLNNAIRKIVPPEPDNVDKIAKDLVGRTWQDRPDGYFGTSSHVINQDEVENVEIVNYVKENPDKVDIEAIITIRPTPGSMAKKLYAEIIYLLEDADDWGIFSLSVNKVEPVKTNQYNHLIETVNHYERYYLKNNSDAALLVGGRYLHYGNWAKYSKIVPPNDEAFIDYYIEDNVIDFVERP